jgi:CRP-like cAMP-binding protein
MTVTPELLRRIPMFDDLQDAEIVEIMSCFSEAEIEAGEQIYLEGEAATNACFLVDGELGALKALPGGGETEVGVILPGAMIGEMALVAGGARTATVRARRPSTVLKVSYHFFHAALDQMSVPAFKILRAIVHTMTRRLGELQARILKQWDCEAYIASSAAGSAEDVPSLPPSFEYRPFLAVMPCFEGFKESEIDDVLARGEVVEIPRGEFLYREGSAPNACYLILRGAVERSVMRDRRYQLSVIGPGRLCGGNAMIAQGSHTSDARVRAQALVLRFDREGFDSLFRGETTECLKFQNLVSANQLMLLKAADNLLALLVSQSYVLSEPRSRSL